MFQKEMELQSEAEQELISKGEVPEKYIQKDTDGEPLDATFPAMDIPIIDLDLLRSSSTSSPYELGKLRSALSTWGCFHAINHGMTLEFLDEVRNVTKQFFELPLEEKQKYSKEVNDIQGYGNQIFLSEQQKLDWSAMASSLNLEENCFLEQYGEGAKVTAKFTIYPPCPRPDVVLGQRAHADGSAITLILQDKNTEGLQFLKENQWFRAPTIPEALFINIGDQAEISSNGIFRSSVHRVVTNSEGERISLVVFYIPEIDKEIGPFEKLVDESRPRLYKKIKNYPDIYFQYFRQGKRPIEATKL